MTVGASKVLDDEVKFDDDNALDFGVPDTGVSTAIVKDEPLIHTNNEAYDKVDIKASGELTEASVRTRKRKSDTSLEKP